MKNEFEKSPSRKPIFEELDLSKAEVWNGKEGIRNFIIERLKTLGLYNPHLIFSGFDGKNINVAKRVGAFIKGGQFYGTNEADLASETRVGHSALDYAFDNDIPALAVYDRERLIGHDENIELDENQYRLRNGFHFNDALVAVFILKE
jgi:hypothetical protein